MLGLLKILPLVAVVGGGAALAKQSGGFFDKVVGKVMILATGYEVSAIASRVLEETVDSGRVPSITDDQDFSEYLRDRFKPRYGQADPALDLWGSPFQIERGSTDSKLIVFSLGPNTGSDNCGMLNGEPTSQEAAQALETDPTTETPEAPPSYDDICYSFEYSLRESPFRPIQR
jgi:hypothetical protein